MGWLAAVWRWLLNLFNRKEPRVTITAKATLTSTGDLTAPKRGDVLTYTVVVTGDTAQASIVPGTFTADGQPVPVVGGPWTWTITSAEQFTAPVVSGATLTRPFAQTVDPHVWVGTF